MRTVSQSVLLTNSLKSWKLVSLKFSILILLFAYFSIPQEHELHHSMITQTAFTPNVTDHFICIGEQCIASPLVGPSITWLKEVILSEFQDSLQLTILVFQQMSV